MFLALNNKKHQSFPHVCLVHFEPYSNKIFFREPLYILNPTKPGIKLNRCPVTHHLVEN